MVNIQTRGDAPRNGLNGHHAVQATAPAPVRADSEEALRQEVQRLTAENQQLLGLLAGGSNETAELERLLAENAELRGGVEELERLLAGGGNPQAWAEQQPEYEALLEEKSEVIRELHQKLQDLRAELEAGGNRASASAASAPVTDRELQALKAELERQREQLEADEESLMTQMRTMEMGMARERAELARQRSELQRLSNDMKHEMEQTARDGALRERLQNLQRRPAETQTKAEPTRPSDPTPAPKNSGLLRRLFRPGT